jgi:hypothetical protein
VPGMGIALSSKWLIWRRRRKDAIWDWLGGFGEEFCIGERDI